jgi:protein-S-isoprenylcysteine O-methyltransferase Ste14
MVKDVPLLLMAATVSAYWLTVAVQVIFKSVRHGRSSGLLPRHAYEWRLWALIVPTVLAWIAFPVLAISGRLAWLSLPAWAQDEAWFYSLRWAAVLLAVVCYVMSLYCWLLLGRQWSMAIVPGQTSELVTSGLYRYVRHPIYGLSMGLMMASAAVLPVTPMVLVACLHLIALNLKARYEERYLGANFGPAYQQYCTQVRRFWPRWFQALHGDT